MTTPNFNGDAVRKLAEILVETDLTEIEYEENGARIYVARQPAPVTVHAAPNYNPSYSNYPTAPHLQDKIVSATSMSSSPSKVDFGSHAGTLKSPMVGSAYLAPEPGAAPFVKVGDSISVGQTMLIVEAMKVMNPIKAIKAGTLTHILVSDSSPVEYDQPLMVIE